MMPCSPSQAHRPKPRRPIKRNLFLAVALVCCPAAYAGAETIQKVVAEQAEADTAAAAAQKKIDALEDETRSMATKYRDALSVADSMNRYSDQLAGQVDSQRARMDEINAQLAGIEVTQREVLPLMERMIQTLEEFVALDVPFLPEERAKRIATLKSVLASGDISISEKYRRILEAYQIEMEYGRTLDAYTGTLGEGDAARTVQFVRMGRLSLMYQTLDGAETGYWDASQKQWVVDPSYERDVEHALSVAKKEGAPELVMAPVPAPVEVTP
jgi:hypothetical protein